MLHQELPEIAARPLDGGSRWLLPALGGAAFSASDSIWLLFGIEITLVLAGLAVAGGFAAATALTSGPPSAQN